MVHLSKYLNLSGTSVRSDLQKSISICFCNLLNDVTSEQWSPSSLSLILPGIYLYGFGVVDYAHSSTQNRPGGDCSLASHIFVYLSSFSFQKIRLATSNCPLRPPCTLSYLANHAEALAQQVLDS